jgi:SAM-dependent methyltransferase
VARARQPIPRKDAAVEMPSLNENKDRWSDSYPWEDAGEEWSRAWGGSEAQWFGSIFPRLHAFVPVGTILELAPGFGRWTRFLRPLCDRMVLVDLSERCIDACRARFGEDGSVEYHVNDGSSLEMVSDASIDFVFSFDSLVHADADVIESYIIQLRHKLTEDGVAFLHHSNFGALDEGTENRHWRSESVSGELVCALAQRAYLSVISQERINWGCPDLSDCVTVLTPKDSRWERPTRIVDNPGFMAEALQVAKWAPLYTSAGAPAETAPRTDGD